MKLRHWLIAFAICLFSLSGCFRGCSKGLKEGTVMTTESGLKIEVQKAGSGKTAEAGREVTVHYTGWLVDGKEFDSSRTAGRQPLVFPLGAGRVIKGWDEGVQGMVVGEKRKLTIPPQLGYGERGAGGVIPPNATLIFEVELLDVGEKAQ